MIFVIFFKMGKHGDFHLSFFQIMGLWQDFAAITKWIKILRVNKVLGDSSWRLYGNVSDSSMHWKSFKDLWRIALAIFAMACVFLSWMM